MGKIFHKLLIAAIVAVLLIISGLSAAAKGEEKTLDVLFVHDTHSHLNEFATVEDGKSQIMRMSVVHKQHIQCFLFPLCSCR